MTCSVCSLANVTLSSADGQTSTRKQPRMRVFTKGGNIDAIERWGIVSKNMVLETTILPQAPTDDERRQMQITTFPYELNYAT